MKKKIFILVSILVIFSISAYFYVYKEHRNIENETSDFVLVIADLDKEFAENDSVANLKYQDKTIEIKGVVTEIESENNSIIIDNKVYASFTNPIPNDIKVKKELIIKGRFIGYDDLLEQFKVDQVTIINK